MTTTEEVPLEERAEERAVLRRSRENRVLFGVCGGLGRYLGIDPVLVRIAFVLLAVFGGSGVLLYLIGLIAIPSEAPGETVPAGNAAAGNGAVVVIGAVLIAVGSLLLAGRVIPAFGDLIAPLVLLSVGVLVLLAGRR
jgi:phage shock protein C